MKKTVTTLTLSVSCCFLFVPLTCASVVHIYVSPIGSDSNDGLQPSSPVKTLNHAVSMLQYPGIQGNEIFVEIMAGYHDLISTLHFTTPINGTVVLRSYQGQEVHVTGGKRIDVSLFKHVTDSLVLRRLPEVSHAKILQLNLTEAGITDLGNLTSYGFGHSWAAPLEIFINGKPLILAEWPNRNFINILSVPDGESGRRFTFDAGGRDVAWAQETEPWVYGWWYWSWADSSLPVAHLDLLNHSIILAADSQYGLRVGHWKTSGLQTDYNQQGGYFRVINMLSELDLPGEYYIDRKSKILYVWPNTPQQTLTSSDIVYGSVINNCIQIEKNVHHLSFQDFTVEACRNIGVDIITGRNITFSFMEFKNIGSYGVRCVSDCRKLTVLASEFHDLGGGIIAAGGDIKTLTSSENKLMHNHIWDFSRVGAASVRAINVEGVHATVSYNHLHHGQYTGIGWSGNDHIMEYNHVHHMCWNSSDCGAFMTGRDWSWRGNVIRHNYIHHTLRYHPGADVRGIMLDDEYSSVLIEKNVFYDNEVHANIGGGRDNIICNNAMYNATKYSVEVDGRGLGSGGHNSTLRQNLQTVPYQSPLWSQRYPELATILTNHPEAPKGNVICKNVFYNSLDKPKIQYNGGSTIDKMEYFNVHDNFYSVVTDDFYAPDYADFRLNCKAAKWALEHHVSDFITLNHVGPQMPTGPNYLRVNRRVVSTPTSPPPSPCNSTTAAPAIAVPRGSYLPDGSSPNTLYSNIAKQGCWLIVDHCPNHRDAEGTYRDSQGDQTGTEEGCLARAAVQWKWCGSGATGQVVAIYGPTGAMTIGGSGCFFAEYGCHGTNNIGFHRDTYAEEYNNASTNEQACLSRAANQWVWCGSDKTRPITSLYRPTGNFRTAGAGCWIKLRSCPAKRQLEGFFYDAWGSTNTGTDADQSACFQRAQDFWIQCGSYSNITVTAFYRPTASNHTEPVHV